MAISRTKSSTFTFRVAHSQTISTRHPRSKSASTAVASRSTLRLIFSLQNPGFVFGNLKFEQP